MQTKIIFSLGLALLSFALIRAQNLNLTFESNAPNESLATHRAWENSNIDLIGGSVVVWGTTIDDGNGNESVYLQTFENAINPGLNIGFDHQYQIVDPFDKQTPLGPTQFHALVEDGAQIVVAATRDWETVGPNVRFLTIFSVDRSSGNVLWTQSIHFGDVMRIDDMQLMRDNNGDFVAAFNLESQLPKWGPVRNRSGIGLVKLDPSGTIQWVKSFRYSGSTYIPNLFRITDLKQNQLATGSPYVVAGSYSRNGPNETAFVMMVNQAGLLWAGLNPHQADLRPGPEDYLSVAADGTNHYVSYATANQQLGLQRFNNAYTFSPTTDIIPAVPNKSQTLSRQLKSGNGSIELMLEYLDPSGAEWSGGFGIFNGATLFYREYDFAPGDKEGIPFGYVAESGQTILLEHPTISSGAMGYPFLSSYVRVLEGSDPANECHPSNGSSQTASPSPTAPWTAFGVATFNKYQKLATKPVAFDYDGMVLDCGLNSFAMYRKAELTESPEAPKITLYPNPASNALQLQGDLSQYEALEILDIQAKVVWRGAINPKISIGKLSPGVYQLRLLGQDSSENIRFVKM